MSVDIKELRRLVAENQRLTSCLEAAANELSEVRQWQQETTASPVVVVTELQIVAKLHAQVEKRGHGGMTAVARLCGVTVQYLYRVLTLQAPPSNTLAVYVGFEKRIMYVKRKPNV